MKKILVSLLSVFCFASFAVAGDWGAGVKLGIGENDPKSLNEAFHSAGGGLTEGNGIFGLEVLYEWNLNDDVNKLGLKVGLDVYGENEWKNFYYGFKVTETIYAFPITLYYKQDYGVKNWSWFAGAGISFMKGEVEDGPYTYKESTVFPHITAGAEYRFTEVFALGLEAKYNINAELKDFDLGYTTDRSGISAALTGRFYF